MTKMIAVTAMAMTASPPMTPPTIAPTGVLFFEEPPLPPLLSGCGGPVEVVELPVLLPVLELPTTGLVVIG